MQQNETKVQLDKSKKDHFNLAINGIELGEFERSQLRHLIQQIDNKL